jgi:hypothetical protein
VTTRPEKIVSGGQTGADRAALDAALEIGIETGGWIPTGRRSEDGKIPGIYNTLVECDSENYATRTALNVRDSDGTLIVSRGPLTGGSLLTRDLAKRYKKPFLHVDLAGANPADAAEEVREWLDTFECRVLNVAGPRASSDPEIYSSVRRLLIELMGTGS